VVQFAVVEATDRNRIFIADFPTERPGLGEANVTRLAWRPAADDRGLRGDEFAMLLVAQSNGLGGHATRPRLNGPDVGEGVDASVDPKNGSPRDAEGSRATVPDFPSDSAEG
jgi:hypothetical protein